MKNPEPETRPAWRGLWLSCREASRAQSMPEAISGRTGFLTRLGLRLHLLVCAWCRRYGRHVHELRRLQRERPENLSPPTPVAWSSGAREQVVQALHRLNHPETAAGVNQVRSVPQNRKPANPAGDGPRA